MTGTGMAGPDPGRGRPLVSVVLAVRDAAPVVERTIESVLSQTYPAVELVVVDGGSTDGTLDILRRFDPRIGRWITGRDRGVYDAYNKGIALAAGEWVYFIGAGDTLAGDRVLEDVLTPPPRGKLVYGNVLWGATGKIYDGRFSRLKLCRRNICHQAVFYRRDLFAALGPFDARFCLVADWVFNLRCFGTRDVAPEYRDIVVARFDLGGLSAKGSDLPFEAERDGLIRDALGSHWLLLDRAYRFQRDLFGSAVKRLKGAAR